MSSSLSDASLIALLNSISTQFNRYLGIVIFVFGLFGNTLNIFVLLHRSLRSNPCAWLFLVSSIANSIGILSGLTSRPLSSWSMDLTNTNQFICKLRIFILFTSITCGSWLIMLATFDRWLSSNTDINKRRRSTLKNAQRGAIVTCVSSIIIEVQHIYCVEANLVNTPLRCYSKNMLCAIVSDLCHALITILAPLLLTLIFGLITISNIRKVQSRLQTMERKLGGSVGRGEIVSSTANATQWKKSDRHLLIMLFIQVLLTFLLSFPIAAFKIYSLITRNTLKSPLQRSIENFVFNILLLLYYVGLGMPFYIYTLSGGDVFRQALFSFFKNVSRKMMCQRD